MKFYFSLKDIFNIISISCILFSSYMHFIIYFGRRKIEKEKYTFFYSIFSLFLFLYILFDSFIIQFEVILIPIEYLIVTTMFYSLYRLSLIVLEEQKTYTRFYIMYISPFVIIGFILSFISLFNYYLYSIYIFIFVVLAGTLGMTIQIGILLYIAYKNHFYKEKENKDRIFLNSMLITFIVFTLLLLLEKIFSIFIEPDNIFVGNFIFAGIVCLYIVRILSERTNKEFEENILLKATLEQKVNDLTAQKTNVFVNVTHELKTPLTVLWNVINDYIKQNGEDKQMRIIKNNADDAVKKVNNFLVSEKIFQGNGYDGDERIYDLSAIISEKEDTFCYNAAAKKLNLSFNIQPCIHVRSGIDPLHFITNNLIENAVKYTEKGGVDVSLTADDNDIVFTVADTGPGIPEELHQKIFEPYFQMTHEKKNMQGIGMGLNIVKGMVDTLGGTVRVESVPGKGSRFIVTLRRYMLKDGDVVESDNVQTISNIVVKTMDYSVIRWSRIVDENKPTILIVEDNRDLLVLLYESFCSRYNVFLALNGKEAVANLGLKHIDLDLVITDLMMDEMDGNEFYDRIKRSVGYENVPFIFITARRDDEEKMKTLHKGVHDYIYKPFAVEELVLKTGNLINNISSQRAKARSEDRMSLMEESAGDMFEKKCDSLLIPNRYKKVIKEFISGKEYKEIAYTLNKSEKTVRNYIQEIYAKVGVNNKQQLMILFKDCIQNPVE